MRRSGDDRVWREFYLCLLWRRISTTETSVRDIYSVAVPEINMSKLEQAAQRLTTCASESRPSQLMKMMISPSISDQTCTCSAFAPALQSKLLSSGDSAEVCKLHECCIVSFAYKCCQRPGVCKRPAEESCIQEKKHGALWGPNHWQCLFYPRLQLQPEGERKVQPERVLLHDRICRFFADELQGRDIERTK